MFVTPEVSRPERSRDTREEQQRSRAMASARAPAKSRAALLVRASRLSFLVISPSPFCRAISQRMDLCQAETCLVPTASPASALLANEPQTHIGLMLTWYSKSHKDSLTCGYKSIVSGPTIVFCPGTITSTRRAGPRWVNDTHGSCRRTRAQDKPSPHDRLERCCGEGSKLPPLTA